MNTIGSFTCQCRDGYRTKTGTLTFSAESPEGCVGKLSYMLYDNCVLLDPRTLPSKGRQSNRLSVSRVSDLTKPKGFSPFRNWEMVEAGVEEICRASRSLYFRMPIQLAPMTQPVK